MGFLKSVGKALGKGAPGLNKAITKMTPGMGGMNRALGIAPPKAPTATSSMQVNAPDAQPIPEAPAAAAPEGGIGPSEEMVQQTMPVQAPVEAPAPQQDMGQALQNQQNVWAQNAQASQQTGQAAGQNMGWMNKPGAMQGPMGGPQSLQQVLANRMQQPSPMGNMAQAGASLGGAFGGGRNMQKPQMQQQRGMYPPNNARSSPAIGRVGGPQMGGMFGDGMNGRALGGSAMGGMFGRAMGQNMGSRMGQAQPRMNQMQQKPQQMM